MFTTEKKASMYYEKFGEFPCMHDVMLVCNVNNLVSLCISYFYIDMDKKFSLIFQRNIKERRIKKKFPCILNSFLEFSSLIQKPQL